MIALQWRWCVAATTSSRNRWCLRAPERDVLQRRGEERAGALSPQATERHAASHAGRRSFLWCTPARRPCGCACVVAASAHHHEPRYYHRAGRGVSMCEDEGRKSQIARAPRIATTIMMNLFARALQNLLSITIEQSIETKDCTISMHSSCFESHNR